MTDPIFLIIDLFCGFGGTTTGFMDAELDGNKLVKIIACVNHDPKAIKSHWLNHPDVTHYEEDIRTLDLTELTALVEYWKCIYPDAYVVLWASLECTNFSKAKGGQPRSADSRTLAEHLFRYQKALQPDYIQIENVVEFMSWGPLDDNGKPLSRKNGQDWMKWRNEMCEAGYYDEWKEMNSADYGAYTSRNRLFGCFAKNGLSIVWPKPTHSKKTASIDMFGGLKKWNAVKEVLNFEDEGESIFTRKKSLSDRTLERIYAGLVKYIANGDTSFLAKYFSGRPEGKVIATDGPAGTITTKDGQSLVQTSFIVQRNSGEPQSKIVDTDGPARTLTATGGNQDLVQPEFLLKYNSLNGKTGVHHPPSVQEPCPVISCQSRLGLVQPSFMYNYYGNSFTSSIENTCPTITTADNKALVQPQYFIDRQYGSGTQHQSVDVPAATLTPVPKLNLVESTPFIVDSAFSNGPQEVENPLGTITANRKYHYIVNPSHGGHCTSTDKPCPVIIARQDKAPLYLIQTENGKVSVAVFDCDTEIMIKIKVFMSAYGLVDIKMRMLRVVELLKIQGFPADYKMVGNQSDHKKFIGNSVHPMVPKAWAEAFAEKIFNNKEIVAA